MSSFLNYLRKIDLDKKFMSEKYRVCEQNGFALVVQNVI